MEWQDATVDTIKRFQVIHELAATGQDVRGLYPEARMITVALGVDDKRFWNVYLNVLRILVMAESGVVPDKAMLFGKAAVSSNARDDDDYYAYPRKQR